MASLASRPRRPWQLRRLAASAVIALAAIVVAPGAPPVRAADDGLDLSSVATYELQPGQRRIHVTVDLTAKNTTPDRTTGLVVTRYFFEDVGIVVQPEAKGVVATSAGARLGVTQTAQRWSDLLRVRLARPLYFDQTARVRITYDLPAAKPRSSSDVRVGVAYSTFDAWAFGDAGRVRIEIPRGYEVNASGSSLQRQDTDGGVVLTSGTVSDPAGWYAIVDARRDRELTSERLSIPSGGSIVVRGWPEDKEWVDRVGDVLTKGIPVLQELIGLPWPVQGDLEVLEVHTPLLEGYAGFYDPESDRITVSEDLEPHVILHEAGHAWFNDALFTGRWIGEGLADEYAGLVADATKVGGDDPFADATVRRSARAAFPLEDWRDPAPIHDDATAAYEGYGYEASRRAMGDIIDLAGIEGMREVLRAARAHSIPYVGAVTAETLDGTPDWRRLLDLVEERADVDVTEVFATWIADDDSRLTLDDRTAARRSYAALVAAGDGWQPPYAVRSPMAGWRFDQAEAQIDAAERLLAERDEIDRRAAALGVTVPVGLEAAYEQARANVAEAEGPAAQRLDGLADLETATAAVGAPRDPVTDVGLLGERPPEEILAEARAAFEGGGFDTIDARSAAVVAMLAAAPDIGRTRLTLTAAALVAVLVLLIVAALLLRRARRRRPVPVTDGPVAVATLPATLPPDAVGEGPDDAAIEGGDGPTGDGRPPPG